MKFKAWTIISEAVERGVVHGFRRAHKHSTEPEESHVTEQIQNAIMSELSEIIDFDSDFGDSDDS